MTPIRKKDRGLFEYQDRMQRLKMSKTPLDKLNSFIPWEMFRATLTDALEIKEQKAPGGSSHYDYVFMFKVLVYQRYYNLSDEKTEFQINDSLSTQRFLGITLSDQVPDQKQIWAFREKLKRLKLLEKLFLQFDAFLEKKGVVGKVGSIVDASFVEVPRQRNSREENEKIKAGEIPADWTENPDKLAQKDTDARWTKKNDEKHYGYKNHVKMDSHSKIVRTFEVTSANVHDSQALDKLLNEKDEGRSLHADSAYSGKPIAEMLEKRGIKNRIHEKGTRGKLLTKEQKRENKKKSRVRVRVEHRFGFQQNSMGGSFIRTIGMERAKTLIGFNNLVYNMARFAQIKGR